MNTSTPPARLRAVITGASSGIGAAYARRLASEGHDLLLVARRADRLEALAAETSRDHDVDADILVADLSEPAGIEAAVQGSTSAPVDVLVHSAGFGTRGHFVDVAESKAVAQVNLHTLAATRLARNCLPGMIERRRGAVILVSSLSGFWTTSHYVSYAATKAFLIMLARGLAEELEGTGVHAQAICPGLTETEFMSTDEYSDFDYSQVPKAMWQTPEQVVEESLGALGDGRPVVVPGRANRLLVALLDGPTGSLIRGSIAVASRLNKARGRGNPSKDLY